MTSGDVASEMARRGHDVTVFTTFPNRPSGLISQGYKRKLWDIEEKTDYRIVRTWHTLSRRSSFLSRTLENITYGLSSTLGLLLTKPPDVVYMNTWPIFAQNLNSLLLKARNIPIVSYVQDVYPESLSAKGMLTRQRFSFRLAVQLDIAHLKRCYTILTLTESMCNLLISQRSVPKAKIKVIPNWLDESPYLKMHTKDHSFFTEHKINPDIFIAMFAGSLTMSAGVDIYVAAAKLLTERTDIILLLIGDGTSRQDIENQIVENNLTNLRVIHPLLPNDVPRVQAVADILMMSLSGEMAQNAAPSKQMSYMFSGRPILASINKNGTPAKIIEKAKAGFIIPPDNPGEIASLLIELSKKRFVLTEMGENAQKFALANYSKSMVLPKIIEVIEASNRSGIGSRR
jgi:colanic acid biosynthesis glycosyl transferase WcaI